MPIISASAASTTSTYRPATAGILKQRVARIVGAELEPTMQGAALEYLNEAIIEFNSRLYECNRVFRTQLTVTNGEASLPAAFYKELECSLVSSTGDRIRQLGYIDWAEHEHTFGYSQQGFGTGGFYQYSLFNIYDEGKLRLMPFTGATDTSYVKISYHRRFPLLTGDGDVLDAPQEIQRALVLKAQTDMLRTHSPGSNALAITASLAEKAWDEFSNIDRKHPDMKPRFRLAPLTGRGWAPGGDGVIYIRV